MKSSVNLSPETIKRFSFTFSANITKTLQNNINLTNKTKFETLQILQNKIMSWHNFVPTDLTVRTYRGGMMDPIVFGEQLM